MCRLYQLLLLLSVAAAGSLNAQVTLFEDNFNSCALAPGWQVSSSGNPNIVWYVNLAQNGVIQNQSIDSTCFLFIDDYTTGPGTPGYVLNFTTPAFDVTSFQTVTMTMDVYFRFGETDFMEILATDGATETLLARFDNYRTNGADLKEHFTVKHDLSLVSQSANTRIIIRYTSPNGSSGYFAGVDNIKIVGSGKAKNIIRESFDNCAKPNGWITQVVSGQGNWKFNRVPLGSSAFYNGNSMDGSCFVFFDDNAEGENAPATSLRLYSPWFSGLDYFKYELSYDAILRSGGKESLNVYLENDKGDKTLLYASDGQIAGPFFPDYQHFTFDLSEYRSQQLRVLFEYSDGNYWGYWVGIDNVKVSAMEPAIDFCSQGLTLLTGDTCRSATNVSALFDGPANTCAGRSVGSLWYRWQADFSGIAQFTTHADFNDVVSIFSGTCASPQPELCDNHDEHGFVGENTYFPVQAGKQYLIRVSGLDEGFGIPKGNVCTQIKQVPAYPTRPANDDCASATGLTVNAPCTAGDNTNALTSTTLPSLNLLARADVWYKFTASNLAPNEQYQLLSNAGFSDIITVYGGTCSALTELAGNHNGGTLDLPALTAGQTYYVQIAGNFATVEGPLCAQIVLKNTAPPVNDNCLAAIDVPVGGACVSGNNLNARFSGYQPDCSLSADRDIWFKFVAPPSGSVHFNTGATFEHTLAIWEGKCDSLHLVHCVNNPLRCNGYINLGDLSVGKIYYIQISSRDAGTGTGTGNVCIRVLDGQATIDFKPLLVEVKLPCVGKDSAKVVITSNGGVPPFYYPANVNGQIVRSGDTYLVVVSDSAGCEAHSTGVVPPCSSNVCTMTGSLVPEMPRCFGENNGSIAAGTTGGTGPYSFMWSNGVPTATNSGLAAGTYTLTVIDANGCDLVLEQDLGQPAAITAAEDSIQHPGHGQSNGAIFVSVSGGAGGYSYAWTKDGTPIGAVTQDLTGIPGGTYALTITDSLGCTGTYTYILTEAVGTQVAKEPFRAAVIPNPTRDKAALEVVLAEPKSLDLTLSDSKGRMLRSWRVEHVSAQRIDIDLDGLASGVYHLLIRAGSDVLTRKIIVGH